jgi:hypothetical protein
MVDISNDCTHTDVGKILCVLHFHSDYHDTRMRAQRNSKQAVDRRGENNLISSHKHRAAGSDSVIRQLQFALVV